MISIIVPFYNEEESLPVLNKEIADVMEKMGKEYEVIYVNDGSTDSWNRNFQNEKIKIISLRKRFGKGEALRVGVEGAMGDIIIFMDADLQDDPKDIPHFITRLGKGFDLVNGVRKIRKDSLVIKTYSSIFNRILKSIFKSPFSDINCGFKAMKKKIFEELILYGNNFRFLPLAAHYQGFKVSEIEVDNRERKYGKSKFGAGKFFIGFLDTISAYFIYQFSEKPLHFFGSVGAVFFITGFIIALYLSVARIFYHQLLYRRPALQLAMLLIIVGIQILMTGIIGELIVYLSKKNSKS